MGRRKSIETDTLLGIARKVFLEAGAFGSTKDIARNAGISEAALFKRFPTKAALFLAAMAPPQANGNEILGPARAEKDPHRALRLLAHQVLSYYRLAIPRMLHLITHPAIGLSALHAHMGPGHPGQLDDAIAEYLLDQHRKGQIHAPNARVSAMLLVAALHSIVLFELMGVHGGAMPDMAVDAMIDAMWLGLRPKPPKISRRKKRKKR